MDAFLEFLKTWGISALIIAVVSFALTQLIKLPIKKWASNKFGDTDKKKVTKYLVFIPIILAFLGSIVDTWIRGHDWMYLFSAEFDWNRVIQETLATMALPALIVSIKENFLEAYENHIVNSLAEGTDEAKAKAETERLELAKANAEANATAKANADAERKAEKEAKAKAKAEALKAKRLAKLQAEIDALNGKTTTVTVANSVPTNQIKIL